MNVSFALAKKGCNAGSCHQDTLFFCRLMPEKKVYPVPPSVKTKRDFLGEFTLEMSRDDAQATPTIILKKISVGCRKRQDSETSKMREREVRAVEKL